MPNAIRCSCRMKFRSPQRVLVTKQRMLSHRKSNNDESQSHTRGCWKNTRVERSRKEQTESYKRCASGQTLKVRLQRSGTSNRPGAEHLMEFRQTVFGVNAGLRMQYAALIEKIVGSECVYRCAAVTTRTDRSRDAILADESQPSRFAYAAFHVTHFQRVAKLLTVELLARVNSWESVTRPCNERELQYTLPQLCTSGRITYYIRKFLEYSKGGIISDEMRFNPRCQLLASNWNIREV